MAQRLLETEVLQQVRASALRLLQHPGFWAPWAAGLATLGCLATPAQAQIQPDATLGTQVNGGCNGGGGSCNITNGATRGGNLFHSFLQFSLPNGDAANFQTTPAIQNVIVRVTGVGQPFISNINGTIATSNPANFFLLNPNGIIFGPGATLNIGGSFLATTAERMLFQDGTVFSARDQTVAPLLTINVPIGVQFGPSPGAIRMQSSYLSAGNTDSFSDFALIGGTVSLEGTTIINPGRRVELGGLAQPGVVDLTSSSNSLSLNFPRGSLLANISLVNDSRISVRGSGGGDIVVNANIFTATNGGRLVGGTEGVGKGGDITVNSKQFNASGIGSFVAGIFQQVLENASGNAGNITVNTNSLSISSGAQIQNVVLAGGRGNAGNIILNVSDFINITGTSPLGQIRSAVSAETQSSGNAGNLTINTRNLSVLEGAILSTGTFATANGGKGGNLTINALNG